MNKEIKSGLLLLLTSFIWGIAFVVQLVGGDEIGPFTFNCIRSFIGALGLVPVFILLEKKKVIEKPQSKDENKILIKAGILCGISMGLASSLQQLGITYGHSAGKAGFITCCYIVLVPVIGIFIGKRNSLRIWICVAVTLVGMYFLCIKGAFALSLADILLIACAFIFAIQILLIDKYGNEVNPIRLSCIEFFISGIVSFVPMIFTEMKPLSGGLLNWFGNFTSMACWITILYGGLLSCGVAYTIQTVAQPNINPTIASLIMCMESVFSVIAGFVLLNQKMSTRELIGCGFILFAVILAQLPSKKCK